MKVPMQEELHVSPSSVPTPRFSAPEMQNAAAERAGRTGEALGHAGNAAARIALDIQERTNKTIVDDALTQYQRTIQDQTIGDDGYLRHKGKDAMRLPSGKALSEEYLGRIDSAREQIEKGLTNPAQKEAFASSAQRMRLSFSADLDKHTYVQGEEYSKSVSAGKLGTAQSDIVIFRGDQERTALAEQNIREATAELNPGIAPDALKLLVNKNLSDAYTASANTMLASRDYAGVEGLLARVDNGETLDPRAAATIRNNLNNYRSESIGENAAREVISALGDGWSMKEADKLLVAKLGDDTQSLNHARTELRYQADQDKIDKNARIDRLLEPVNLVVGDASNNGSFIDKGTRDRVLYGIRATPGGDEAYRQAAMLMDQHNDRIRSEREHASDRARMIKERVPPSDQAIALWYTYKTNPSSLISAPLTEYRDVLGDKYFNDLVGDQQSLRGKKVEENTIINDKQAFDMVLKGAGYRTDEHADFAKLGKLYQAYDDLMRASGGSSALTQKQKMDVARGVLLGDVVTGGKYIPVINYRVGDSIEKLSDVVPASEIPKIVEALALKGKPITNQGIYNLYKESIK